MRRVALSFEKVVSFFETCKQAPPARAQGSVGNWLLSNGAHLLTCLI